MTKEPARLYEFGPFRLDVQQRLFLKDGEPVPLTPRTFDVLAVLVREHGKLVTKDEFLSEIWPDSFVEETNLPQNVYLLRKALGDQEYTCPKFIETVSRHGYRFIAAVKEVTGGDAELIIHQRTRAEILIEQEHEEDDVREDLVMPPASRPLSSAPVPRLKTRTIAFLALGLLATLTALSFFLLRGRNEAGSTPKSIAVLPFKTIGADESHLGLGMTDTLITKLSSLRQFTVMPTSAVFRYADGENDPLVAGQALGAEAILDGTVQRSGDEIRVTVRLIRVLDGESLWAETFDEKFTNIFSTQDAISERVTRAMRYRLTTQERQRLAKQPTNNVEAYEAYVRGVYFWNKRTSEGLRQSIRYFEHAVEQDPNYAAAFAGLSDSYAIVGYAGYDIMPRREAFEKARAAVRRALELDEGLAEAHTALAVVRAYYDGDYAGAEESLQHAIGLNPSYGTAHFRYSLLLLLLGRLDEARRAATKAQELDPLSAIINTNLGYMLYVQRDFEKAEVSCRKALETEPNFFTAQYHLGLIYIQQGRHDEAIEVLRKADQLESIRYEILEAIGYTHAVTGRKAEALGIISEMETAAIADKDVYFNIAVIHAGLGDLDRAFEYLGKLDGDLGLHVMILRFDPRLDKLRARGEYAQLRK